MSDQPLPPLPPPPPGENEEDIPPPPPPPPLPPADETVSLEIDFEKLAERAAVIAREQQQQQQHQQQKKRKQRDSPSGKKNIPPPPMPPVSLGGTVLDEVDLERIKVGDNRWGIALSSCVEYPNKKYFFRYDAFVGVVCFSQTEGICANIDDDEVDVDDATRSFCFFFSLSLSPFCRRPRKTFDSHLIFSSLSLLPYRYYLKQPQRLQSLPVGNAERAQRRLAKKSAHMPARSDVTAAKHHAGKRVGGINNNFNNKRSE